MRLTVDEHSHFGPPNTPILDQDIVTRLQDQANAPALAWLTEAADEIERLRTALNNALRSQPHHSCPTGLFPCWCEEARRG